MLPVGGKSSSLFHVLTPVYYSSSVHKCFFSASSSCYGGWKSWFGGGEEEVTKVLQKGGKEEEVLRGVAKEYDVDEIDTLETRELLQKMKKVMHQKNGMGLAAPQIGISKRLFIAEMGLVEGAEGMEALPFTAFFNPKLKAIGNTKFQNLEGCLSVEEGDLIGLVKRFHKIRIEFLNEQGHPKVMIADGYISGLVQHENDHLNGVLFTDREVQYKNVVPSLSKLRGSFRYVGEGEK